RRHHLPQRHQSNCQLISKISLSANGTELENFPMVKRSKPTVSFSADLDNQWLSYSHTDRLPNKYKARGMWGFDRESGKFVMLLNDNFGGARLFVSDGWADDKIVFNRERLLAALSVEERFTFAC